MDIRRRIKALVWRNFLAPVRDGISMNRLQPLVRTSPYIPWTESALSATAVSTVLNDIIVNDRQTIVECGGGVSSLFIGTLLKSQSQPHAHLYTIEHDQDWLEVLRQMIDDHEVADWITLIHAPLCNSVHSWAGERWYDETIIEATISGRVIDLLLVDGPPAHLPETAYSRYPAGPFFKEMLGERCCVVLDDIDRAAEQEIVKKWESDLGIMFRERLLKGNVALGTRGAAFTV